MVTRYRAWMGEEALEDLDPSIIIIDISEDAPKEAVTTEARPGGGMYLTGQLRQSITVTIAVEIHEANTITGSLSLVKSCAGAAVDSTCARHTARNSDYTSTASRRRVFPRSSGRIRWESS